MERLMNSLLVWKNNQLMPMSSALSTDEQERLRRSQAPTPSIPFPHERVALDASSAQAPVSPARDPRPRRGNTTTSSQSTEQDGHQLLDIPSACPQGLNDTRSAAKVAARRRRGPTSVVVPCSSVNGGERPKLSPVRPSRALRLASATSAQRTKAKIELFDAPPLGQQQNMLDDMEVEFVYPAGYSPGYDDGPLDIVTIEDYEKANPTPPPAEKLPRRTSQPIRVSSKGEHTGAFVQACQARGVTWEFNCFTVADGCFDIVLKLNGQKVDRIGQYASHKDAKEAICEKFLPTVLAMPNLKKRKSIESPAAATLPGINDEKWVNILIQYTQNQKFPNPVFTETGVHSTLGPFLCTVRFQASPLQQFGSNVGPCSNKATAKKAAAMEAVLWLRSQGLISEIPVKKQKSNPDPNPSGTTGLTQTLKDVTESFMQDEKLSIGEQVHRGASELGFTQPKFVHTVKEGAFYDTHAQFLPQDVRREPRLDGEVAKVFNVFGKRAAQQDCGRALLAVFDEMRRSQLGS